jgi:hypothetical protein
MGYQLNFAKIACNNGKCEYATVKSHIWSRFRGYNPRAMLHPSYLKVNY